VPKFPLPKTNARERAVWNEAWKSPQATAWATEPWRWRNIAMWCRVSVICEDPSVAASMLAQVHRYADQVGMTPAGLIENGWYIDATPPPAAVDADAAEKAELANVLALFGDAESA
jgi:hypothetical protein